MGEDAELEQLRAGVNCATALEKLVPGWRLDRRESTRRSLKYRRGAGEVLIVNHDGRGWWDPMSDAKGDVFTLVQHLDPSLNFGQVRRVLRDFVGIAPSYPASGRGSRRKTPAVPVAERWQQRGPLTRGSATWRYLTEARALPPDGTGCGDRGGRDPRGAARQRLVRAPRWGRAVDRVRDAGPTFRGFSAGGDKSLFRLPGAPGRLARLAVLEAPIDALSLAAIEGLRPDTLYLSTTGGMGPLTIAALEQLLGDLAGDPAAVLIVATDADQAGQRYAARLGQMAGEAGVGSARILPPGSRKDWNDALRAGAVS